MVSWISSHPFFNRAMFCFYAILLQVVLNDNVGLACEKRRPVTATECRNYVN